MLGKLKLPVVFSLKDCFCFYLGSKSGGVMWDLVLPPYMRPERECDSSYDFFRGDMDLTGPRNYFSPSCSGRFVSISLK